MELRQRQKKEVRFDLSNGNKDSVGGCETDGHPYQEMMYKMLDRVWSKLPSFLGSFLATLIIFMAGISMKGEWLLILVHLMKQFSDRSESIPDPDAPEKSPGFFSLSQYRLQDVHWYVLSSAAISYVMYFGLCGFLQWYFYIRQRDHPEVWKCQPTKFLTWENERHEIILGTLGIGLGSTISGFVSCYVMNGGYSSLYFEVSDYGWIYLVISAPLVFLLMDCLSYYYHRMFHLPFFYKRFHKLHHRYKQPTPFSASAMHPIEFIILESAIVLPMFLIPVHWAVYMSCLIYIYYYGIMDHSGVKMEALWPWQPNTTFHDNHHEFFHTNFGFNTSLWDRLHGTERKEDRIYSEDIFYGFGKSWKDSTQEEKETYLKEHEEQK